MKNSEQGAFPADTDKCRAGGLTKREYFAGLAMQGMLANKDANTFDAFTTAEISIKYAEEPLNQLEL